ncbi:MAG: hypothetical protein GY711_06110 [bacterium]|nr:hypothetical protein [bacterium]
MRLALVNVPQGDPTQVYLSVPKLVSYVRSKGFEDTLARDLNIDAYVYFLRAGRIETACRRIRARLTELDMQPVLSKEEAREYRAIVASHAIVEHTAAHVAGALETLRSKELFYDFDRYSTAIAVLNDALRIISTEFYPCSWSLFDLALPNGTETFRELMAGVEDLDHNPFVEFFDAVGLPWLEKSGVDMLGISITYATQIIPGLTLAKLVKERLPGVRVALGGGVIGGIARDLLQLEDWFPFVDYVVYSEGETALYELMRALEEGREDLSDVPNLIFREPGTGCSKKTDLRIEDLNQHPTPQFGDMPLGDYLSPKPVLMLDVTRGCYWGKCAFCSYGISPETLMAYRERSIEKTLGDIQHLMQAHGTDTFMFSVDVLSLSFVRKLGEALRESDTRIHWMGDLRLETKIDDAFCAQAYDSGCRFVSAGLESSVQRVMDHMEKGTDERHLTRILRSFRAANIGVNTQFFFGFPTETPEEARQTLDLVLAENDSISTVGFGHFRLNPGSAVERDPEKYGVQEIQVSEPGNVSRYLPYTAESGMSSDEAAEFFSAAREKVARAYPVTSNASLLIGAHGLLHLARLGPGEFNRVTRATSAPEPAGAVPAAHDAQVELGPKTLLLRLSYDLFDMIAGGKGEDERFSDGAYAHRPTTVLYDGERQRCCRLSARMTGLVEQVDGTATMNEIIRRQQSYTDGAARRIFRRFHREGFVRLRAERPEVHVVTRETGERNA